MAGKRLGDLVMDNGLAYIEARVVAGDTVTAHLLKGWLFADAYAAALAKSIGSVALTAPLISAPTTDGANGRRITISALNIAATTGSTTGVEDLHVAIMNETATAILAVNDITNDQAITAPNPVDISSYNIDIAQATQ